VRRGDDGNPAELPMSIRQSLEERDTFGAEGKTIRRVFDVAAGNDASVGRFDGCANLEMREVGARVLASVAGGFDQGMRIGCRVPNPGSRIPAGLLIRVAQ
jgi:hypothetical protein